MFCVYLQWFRLDPHLLLVGIQQRSGFESRMLPQRGGVREKTQVPVFALLALS